MKRFLSVVLLSLMIFSTVEPAFAARARTRVVRRGPHGRTVVVVRTGHPIRRPLRAVVVHPVRAAVRVSALAFLPLVVWAPVVAARPERDLIVWQDSETIYKEEDWTEFTLNADARGEKLLLEISQGKAQIDFAEVVFENGDCQVVDFNERAMGAGVYSLLDFKDGRKVDHVRVFARAKSDEAKLALLMRK